MRARPESSMLDTRIPRVAEINHIVQEPISIVRLEIHDPRPVNTAKITSASAGNKVRKQGTAPAVTHLGGTVDGAGSRGCRRGRGSRCNLKLGTLVRRKERGSNRREL